jgi:CCR4-NOT transcription complex subunit 1
MCFLQKMAIQKSIIELERLLQSEFELRLTARNEGKTHYDPVVLSYHNDKMPDTIKLRVGSVSPQQFSVYEEFSKNLPGFKMNDEMQTRTAAASTSAPSNSNNIPNSSNFNQVIEEINTQYDQLIVYLRNEMSLMPVGNHFLISNIHGLINAIHEFKTVQQQISASNLLKKLIYNLLESYTLIAAKNQNHSMTSNEQQQTDLLITKHHECNLACLKVILNDQRFCSSNWLIKEVQKIWLECPHDYKYSPEGIATLFKFKMLPIQTVDQLMAQNLDINNGSTSTTTATSTTGTTTTATSSSNGSTVTAASMKSIQQTVNLLKYFYIEAATTFSEIQLTHLMEAAYRVQATPRHTQQWIELRDTLEVIRMNYETDQSLLLSSNNADQQLNSMTSPIQIAGNRVYATALSMMYTGVTQAKDFDDPPEVKEKSERLLHDWIQHHSVIPPKDYTKGFQQFVLQMNSQGLFKTDETITRFFRICTEISIASSYPSIKNGMREECYARLDGYVKLIILLVKHSGDQTNHVNKINLFNKVLGLIAGSLLHDYETKGSQFEPMPFQRLFHTLLFEAVYQPDNNLEPITQNILQAFVNVYNIVRPVKAPGFAFAWLELISERIFLSKMLQIPASSLSATLTTSTTGIVSGGSGQSFKMWNMYANILTQQIRFLSPFLRSIELNDSINELYTGTLRIFLVLLHDFPEFLCNCHYQFCDVIPSNCIQLRNLVLSAFPRCMKLPDPVTPNLKVDTIGDLDSSLPKIVYPYIYNIPQKLKNDLDSYIKTRSPVTFLSDLRSYLQAYPDTSCNYNIQLMNALVIYVGTHGIQMLRSKNLMPSLQTLQHPSHSAHSDIFQSLVVDLDSEGRYLFINAVTNQLRYPNSHTHYFGCALLNLFLEANSEAIQEIITR